MEDESCTIPIRKMKIEEQVVSIELAKEMKKLGAPQDSYFTWCEYGEYESEYLAPLSAAEINYKDNYFIVVHVCAAFTVAELGEMLPFNYQSTKLYLDNGESTVEWCCCHSHKKQHCEYADTEADARAKMWLYLKKKKRV